MGNIKVTIFLGPIGVGKTFCIEEMKKKTPHLIHIHPDTIHNQLIENYIAAQRRCNAPVCEQDLYGEGLGVRTVYIRQLKEEIAAAQTRETDTHIIIDNPPTMLRSTKGPNPWACEVAAICKSHNITVDAIVLSANPENTLNFVLERECHNKRYPEEIPHILDPTQDDFRTYLSTYKLLPDQTDWLAACVSQLQLFDNNGFQRRLIASYQAENGWNILDASAYGEFRKLQDITPHAAYFEILGAETTLQNGEWNTKFNARPIRFFGASEPQQIIAQGQKTTHSRS